MGWSIQYAKSASGKVWVYVFLIKLDQRLRTRTMKQLALLQQVGPNLGPPLTKKIRSNLYELRVLGQVQVRILFTTQGNSIILLHALIKNSQKLNQRDINTALKRIL